MGKHLLSPCNMPYSLLYSLPQSLSVSAAPLKKKGCWLTQSQQLHLGVVAPVLALMSQGYGITVNFWSSILSIAFGILRCSLLYHGMLFIKCYNMTALYLFPIREIVASTGQVNPLHCSVMLTLLYNHTLFIFLKVYTHFHIHTLLLKLKLTKLLLLFVMYVQLHLALDAIHHYIPYK